jgi:hypothetical protein
MQGADKVMSDEERKKTEQLARQRYRGSAYEEQWAQLKASARSGGVLNGLGFSDYPWPAHNVDLLTPKDLDETAVKTFLGCMDKLQIQRELKRRHPDKFVIVKQCFDQNDHAKILDGIHKVAQILIEKIQRKE